MNMNVLVWEFVHPGGGGVVRFRNSKNLADTAGRGAGGVARGESVRAEDAGDGWLKVEGAVPSADSDDSSSDEDDATLSFRLLISSF